MDTSAIKNRGILECIQYNLGRGCSFMQQGGIAVQAACKLYYKLPQLQPLQPHSKCTLRKRMHQRLKERTTPLRYNVPRTTLLQVFLTVLHLIQ